MKKSVFLLVVCVLLYVWPAPTDSEMVWLKDVTTSFETEKRTLSDLDLPNELTFHLRSSSHNLTLRLKRNHEIDPNADVYIMRTLKNGRSLREKVRNLEKEDVAYYQDRGNWAFMTVRCVKRSNGQCVRGINGNIRIGDRNYDLRPAETDVASRNLLDVPDLLGTRYVLHDQANIQTDISIKNNKDAANVNEKNIQQEIIDLLRRFPHQQIKRNDFSPINSMSSSRNVAGLYDRGTTEKRAKKDFWIGILVVLDLSVWNWYLSLVEAVQCPAGEAQVISKIREAYSHIINGVHMIYQNIEDTSIDFSVPLRGIYILKTEEELTKYGHSVTEKLNGKTYVSIYNYYKDFQDWDEYVGTTYGTQYSHAMLFTKHDCYNTSISDNVITGVSSQGGICYIGDRLSLVEASDYFTTVTTAAHELGHNLGAFHDGDGDAKVCPAADKFIMAEDTPKFKPGMPYSRNPWMFSKCSVRAFKEILKDSRCMDKKGNYKEDSMKKLPGDVYSILEQCQLANGPKSVFCGVEGENVCLFMRCTNSETEKCQKNYLTAARGTKCGEKKWCIEGRCVSKA